MEGSSPQSIAEPAALLAKSSCWVISLFTFDSSDVYQRFSDSGWVACLSHRVIGKTPFALVCVRALTRVRGGFAKVHDWFVRGMGDGAQIACGET